LQHHVPAAVLGSVFGENQTSGVENSFRFDLIELTLQQICGILISVILDRFTITIILSIPFVDLCKHLQMNLQITAIGVDTVRERNVQTWNQLKVLDLNLSDGFIFTECYPAPRPWTAASISRRGFRLVEASTAQGFTQSWCSRTFEQSSAELCEQTAALPVVVAP
jgi:hypothetical protein